MLIMLQLLPVLLSTIATGLSLLMGKALDRCMDVPFLANHDCGMALARRPLQYEAVVKHMVSLNTAESCIQCRGVDEQNSQHRTAAGMVLQQQAQASSCMITQPYVLSLHDLMSTV